ncbi:MAG: hypothetical protein WAO35_22190 [Terriglobia bacterium]
MGVSPTRSPCGPFIFPAPVRAPHIDGRTGSLQVYAGNIAKVNDTVLVVSNQIHPTCVTFAVPEQYLAEVKEYQARDRSRGRFSPRIPAQKPL